MLLREGADPEVVFFIDTYWQWEVNTWFKQITTRLKQLKVTRLCSGQSRVDFSQWYPPKYVQQYPDMLMLVLYFTAYNDSGYATCWSWRRCWCHWWRWQQFTAHCHEVNRISTMALHCIVVISLVKPVLSLWFDLVCTGLEVDVWWKHSSSENLQITISSTGYSPSKQ